MDRRSFLMAAGGAGAAALLPASAGAQELPLGPLAGTRYPDPRIEALDPRFRADRQCRDRAHRDRLSLGRRAGLCPRGGYLLWSDIPNNRIMRWSEDDGHVSVFRSPSNYSNGNTRDREGRLITCEHDTRRVTRTEPDGSITVLIDRFEGKRLNAPNDAVVTADGAIWFTDPGYGILGNYEGHMDTLELPPQVYRLDPRSGRATVCGRRFRPAQRHRLVAGREEALRDRHGCDPAAGRMSAFSTSPASG